jgi:hypothetical protein
VFEIGGQAKLEEKVGLCTIVLKHIIQYETRCQGRQMKISIVIVE